MVACELALVFDPSPSPWMVMLPKLLLLAAVATVSNLAFRSSPALEPRPAISTVLEVSCEGSSDYYIWPNCLCQPVFGSISHTCVPIGNCEGCTYVVGLIYSCYGSSVPVSGTGSFPCGDGKRVMVPCYGQPGEKMITFYMGCGDC